MATYCFAKDYYGTVHGIRYFIDCGSEIELSDAIAAAIEADAPGTIQPAATGRKSEGKADDTLVHTAEPAPTMTATPKKKGKSAKSAEEVVAEEKEPKLDPKSEDTIGPMDAEQSAKASRALDSPPQNRMQPAPDVKRMLAEADEEKKD